MSKITGIIIKAGYITFHYTHENFKWLEQYLPVIEVIVKILRAFNTPIEYIAKVVENGRQFYKDRCNVNNSITTKPYLSPGYNQTINNNQTQPSNESSIFTTNTKDLELLYRLNKDNGSHNVSACKMMRLKGYTPPKKLDEKVEKNILKKIHAGKHDKSNLRGENKEDTS